MKAVVFHEPGVTALNLSAVTCGVGVLGRNLEGVGGLQVSTESVDCFPSLRGQPNIVDPDFIKSAPQWAGGGYSLLVTPRRLGGNALHGRGIHGGGLAIVSTYGLGQDEEAAAYKVLATTIHESGHGFGLVEPDRARYDRVSAHCGNICVMQAGDETDPNRLATIAAIGNAAMGGFCGGCSDDLQRISF